MPPAPTNRTRDCKHLSMVFSKDCAPSSNGGGVIAGVGAGAKSMVKSKSSNVACGSIAIAVDRGPRERAIGWSTKTGQDEEGREGFHIPC